MLSCSTLQKFRDGDSSAFAEVVRVEGGHVRAVAARYFRSFFDQEEAIQEIWMRAYANREAFDVERLESFPSWLRVLAQRRCIDLLRRRQEPVDHRDDLAKAPLDRRSSSGSQLAAAEQAQLQQAVERFVAGLKPDWRDFFQAHFIMGMTYGEVAQQLSLSKLRCRYMKKVLVARARKNRPLLEALGRYRATGVGHAS